MRERDSNPTFSESLSIDALLAAAAVEPPDISTDAGARLLGLVEDPRQQLDGRAMKKARQRARLTASELAAHLESRGWEITAAGLMKWEMRSAVDVPPALIGAIALTLSADVKSLTSEVPQLDERIASLRSAPRFQEVARRFGVLKNLSKEAAARALESRVLAAVHRGEVPELDETLASLEELMDALEQQAR